MDLNESSASGSLPRLVVAAALERPDGCVLMQRRPAGKAHAGLWEFPGGKVDAGEAADAALARELAEELGIAVATADLIPTTFAADAGLVLLLFRCRRWMGKPHALEASALCWEVPARLARLPMPPLDVPLVAALAVAGPLRADA